MSATPPAAADDATFSCPDCGYDLRGIERSDRCPECGLAIERDVSAAASRIPWTHRIRIGRVRAYLRTFWLATFNPESLAREVARPVDYRDAQRFRVVTAVLAAAAPAAGAAILMWQVGGEIVENMDLPGPLAAGAGGGPPAGVIDALMPWLAGVTLWPVLPLAILLFLLAATGVPSYWFHPKHIGVVRQNRAVALSHYTCAPLAFLVVPVCCVAGILLIPEDSLTKRMENRLFLALVITIYVTVPAILLAYFLNTLRLVRRLTVAGLGWTVWSAAGMLLAWAACAVMTLFVLPWIVGLVRIVIVTA